MTIFGYTLWVIWNMDQPDDHLDTWLGIGGFKYKHSGRKGYYLFLYYGKKLIHINLDK
jgi:hypothetical protein